MINLLRIYYQRLFKLNVHVDMYVDYTVDNIQDHKYECMYLIKYTVHSIN